MWVGSAPLLLNDVGDLAAVGALDSYARVETEQRHNHLLVAMGCLLTTAVADWLEPFCSAVVRAAVSEVARASYRPPICWSWVVNSRPAMCAAGTSALGDRASREPSSTVVIEPSHEPTTSQGLVRP